MNDDTKAATATKNKLAKPDLKGYRLAQATRLHATDAEVLPVGHEVQLDDDAGADLVARGLATRVEPAA